MTFDIEVTSEKKGSNPGGRCTVLGVRPSFPGYFKFCYGSKIHGRDNCLTAQHQPIYEAITFELARKLGLKTANFYVLLNGNNDIKFTGWRQHGQNDPSGRKMYCLSRIFNPYGKPKNPQGDIEVIEREKPYLGSLLIADVVGKKQNYIFSEGFGGGVVTYLDLGCSFVHAVGGFLEQPNRLRPVSKDEVKRMKKELKGKTIIAADNTNFVNLEYLIDEFDDLSVPTMNPCGRERARNLLSSAEMDEIRGLMVQGLDQGLRDYGKSGLLIEG